MWRTRRFALAITVGVLALAVVAVGCGDDEEEPAAETPGPGVVTAKPADATQVDVTLQEWAVAPSQPSVAAGEVYFLVENIGPDDPHEFVIIRTDVGPLDLPFDEEEFGVPEDEVDIVDEIEPFTPGSTASIAVDLAAGKYLLICNITEEEDGELESHYKQGMVAAFTVE
jgi:uncharacterized cupredoxin-like copper-binding protein